MAKTQAKHFEAQRRRFLQNTVYALGAAAATAAPHPAYAKPLMPAPDPLSQKRAATDLVKLGSTGITLSRLAMGTGTHGFGGGSDQTRGMGVKGLGKFLAEGFDQGITFWDTADGYGSHRHVGAGLQQLGKRKAHDVVILTKTQARTAKEMQADLERFCKEVGRDHLDVVLLHCMTSGDWPKERQGAMEVLERAREKGMVRAHGVSCHSLAALKAAAASPWVQVDLARINPAGAHMDADPDTVLSVLRQMKAAGKAVIGMKLLGQGDLSHNVEAALRFAVRLDCLDAFTIGFAGEAQRAQVIRTLPRVSVA